MQAPRMCGKEEGSREVILGCIQPVLLTELHVWKQMLLRGYIGTRLPPPARLGTQ